MSFHGGFLGCVLAVILFARRRGIPCLSLGDVTCAVAPIGLFLGRIANFINGELWGRATDVPWAMVFPSGGPLPRHPSQLYEAALEGLVLLVVLACSCARGALRAARARSSACSRSATALARLFCELFREPDAQLGFLWGGLTMGMLLSLPLMLAGIAFIVAARRAEPLRTGLMADEIFRRWKPKFAGASRCAGPMPVAQYMTLCLTHPRLRLLHDARSARHRRRLHHRARDQPDVRRADRPVGAPRSGSRWARRRTCAWSSSDPGRGTMMLDALRAAQVLPEFRDAIVVHFVEISPALEKRQRQAFGGVDVAGRVAQGARGRAGRPADHPRQRVLRRAAGPAGGDVRRRLARARGQDRRRRQLRVQHRPRPDPAVRRRCCRRRSRDAADRRDLRVARRPGRARARPARGALGGRGAGHRLRPCRERDRRHVAGRRRATNSPIRW